MDSSSNRIPREESELPKLPWAHLRLPPFPQVAVRVLQLVQNENLQLHQLCELISSDPAFAGEVLTVANSLLYAPRYPAEPMRYRECASRWEFEPIWASP